MTWKRRAETIVNIVENMKELKYSRQSIVADVCYQLNELIEAERSKVASELRDQAKTWENTITGAYGSFGMSAEPMIPTGQAAEWLRIYADRLEGKRPPWKIEAQKKDPEA